MKALIKNNDSYYTSYVLAISNEKYFWNTRIIVFNDAYNLIKMISCYQKEKIKSFSGYNLYTASFIFDYDDSNFVTAKKWKGLSSIVENDSLIKKLESNNLVSVFEVNELKEFAKEVKIPKWNELITVKDIQNFEMISSSFHDACVEFASRENNNLYLTLSCMDCIIIMKFIDIIEEDIEDRMGQILNSKLEKIDDTLKWTIIDGFGGWTDGIDHYISAKGAFIRCKQIMWSFKFKFEN